MSVSYPLINGFRHSWASVEIRVDGDIILGITELNYKATLEPGEVRGAGPRPIAFTVGQASFEGDFSILLEEFNTLIQKLGDGYMSKSFDIIATHDESGSGLSTIVDTVKGCRITSTENASSAGSSDPNVRKLPFKALGVLFNGVEAAPVQPSATS